MQDKDKAAAAKVRNAIKEHLKNIADKLTELAKLHAGDGYAFQCNLTVTHGIVAGQLSGKAFKIVDGQLVYMPGDDEPDESQRGSLQSAASDEVQALFDKLDIREGGK